MIAYRGLTWDHPRGTDALRAAAELARHDGLLDLSWEAQPLEGFESHPIEDLAARYDLIVMDHPHLGDAIAHDCLVALDTLFDADELQMWADAAIGRTFTSYHMAGHQWALPLDAATQVRISTPDAAEFPMETWADIENLPDGLRVALSLAGPHAALSFFSLCAGQGEPVSTKPGNPLITNNSSARRALEIMGVIAARMERRFWPMNPIALHEAVAARELDICPLVYGYASYGRPMQAFGLQRVSFGDVPKVGNSVTLGTTLGGTGICVTKRATITPQLLAHVRLLMSPTTQVSLFPENSGQPYHVRAWSDPAVNRAYGGFFQATRKSLAHAWVRPRWAGYTAYQLELSALIRSALERQDAPEVVIDRINRHHAERLRPALSEV